MNDVLTHANVHDLLIVHQEITEEYVHVSLGILEIPMELLVPQV